MNQALQTTTSPAAWLLAHPEHLSLERATSYLVGRVRARTPLGAAEYLKLTAAPVRSSSAGSLLRPDVLRLGLEKIAREMEAEGLPAEEVLNRQLKDGWRQRVQLAATKMAIYRTLFGLEYGRSQSPPYSLQRERELYELVNRRLFPIDMDLIKGELPYLPMIPVQGTQEHDWEKGCCAFEQLQTVFKLALVLSGRKGKDGWRQVKGITEQPAPPLDAISWPLFVYALAIEPGPLRHFVDAINLTCYSTKNPWLDTPSDGFMPYEWSASNVAQLTFARVQAGALNAGVAKLDQWLDEGPERVGRLVALWNKASNDAGAGVRLWRRR